MPFYVAVEEPDACKERGTLVEARVGRDLGRLIRVVGAEAEDDVAHWSHHEGVPPHGHLRHGLVSDIVTAVVVGAGDGLELVAVQVEWVAACVVVIEDDFDNVVFLKDVRIGVDGVDGSVIGIRAGAEGCVKRGDFGSDVGYVVEGGTV